ncbi:hypothetical protein HIV01_006015 [Lysobacter arenosi]|uniref:Tetratricopeptide repeat protein n=1 Tax=Lysobacter arenosi TaxID=2795387 RepID=A0ABX7RD32_9GAMM|nr:hypothetical protein [Lysobacter arenosi]QSX76053.1 hypothetical protein HIV01_006015 [Lysobacter arenosi]
MTWQQVRVDAEVGAPFGPDRLVAGARGLSNDANALTAVARDTLRDRPIDGGAFRLLGLAAGPDSDGGRAVDLYRTAARLSPRDDIAQAMLIDASFAQGRVGEGVQHVDALLRIAPHLRAPLLASLLQHTGNSELVEAMVKALAADPPWRGALATALAGTDPTQAEAFLAAMANAAPLTPAELAVRVEALTALGDPTLARKVWLQSLSETDRTLDGSPFDGGFEGADQTGGFGWKWNDEPGVTIAVDAIDPVEGQQSLQMDFSGRVVRFIGPRQRLVLSPGTYEISSAVDDRTGSSRRFAWFVQCTQGPTLVELDLPAGSSSQWQTERATFDVPPDCQGQQLTLRHTGRSMAERQISGVLRVDDVRLRKVPSSVTLPSASHPE